MSREKVKSEKVVKDKVPVLIALIQTVEKLKSIVSAPRIIQELLKLERYRNFQLFGKLIDHHG